MEKFIEGPSEAELRGIIQRTGEEVGLSWGVVVARYVKGEIDRTKLMENLAEFSERNVTLIEGWANMDKKD